MSDEQYYYIGDAAGKIFKYLEQKGENLSTAVKKGAGIDDAALFNQGLGWLAREGKIRLTQSGKNVKIGLQPAASQV